MMLVCESHQIGKLAVMLDREHVVVHEIWCTEMKKKKPSLKCCGLSS